MQRTPLQLLRAWIAQNEVTQAEICRATGIRPQAMCHILKGRHTISKTNALRLAAYTGIPVENLVNQKLVLILRINGSVSQNETQNP
jgi:transcriptional regulator with XRE-family HTH domain